MVSSTPLHDTKEYHSLLHKKRKKKWQGKPMQALKSRPNPCTQALLIPYSLSVLVRASMIHCLIVTYKIDFV